MTPREALAKAIKNAGGQQKLGKKLGVPQSLVSYWLRKSKAGVPAEFAGRVETETGIPRHALRPDIFTPPQQVA